MKADSQLFSTPFTALVLKLAGIILILGVLVDYLVMTVPPNFLNSEWLANLIEEWINRGTIPLLGLALVLFGVWIQDSGTTASGKSGMLITSTAILSAILGLLFLLMAPLYFNSSRLVSAASTRKINQEAAQAESQLNVLLAQQRDRVSALLENDDQLAQLNQQIENADLPEDQQAELRKIQETLKKAQNDPKLLDQEVEKARTQGLSEIKARQQEALSKATAETRKNRIRTILSSLLFAIGYLGLAWNTMGGGSSKPKRSKAKKARTR